jgi:hypothetical protein
MTNFKFDAICFSDASQKRLAPPFYEASLTEVSLA